MWWQVVRVRLCWCASGLVCVVISGVCVQLCVCVCVCAPRGVRPRPKQPPFCPQISGSALKRLARFDAGTHNETWMCPGYYETINRFLHEVRRGALWRVIPVPSQLDLRPWLISGFSNCGVFPR